ncbi:MAG: ABC transporter substrate-binding protein [Candidatus Bipolaricaulia bacterium]
MESKLTRRSFLKFAGLAALGLLTSPRLLRAKTRAEEPLQLSYPLSLEAIPLKFAEKEGLFRAEGLEVEVLALPEDLARRDAFISGRLDGLICDLSTVVFGVANAGAEIAITSTAFEQVPGSRTLALLGSGPFGIRSLGDLFSRVSGRSFESIMILMRSDMHYATDQLLAGLGRSFDDKVIYTEGGDLVNIYTLLIGGSILAAVLPEPLATLAGPKDILLREQDRATYLSTYEGIKLMPAVIAFQRKVLSDRPEQLERFYRAYSRAVEEINAAPREEFLDLTADIGIEVLNQVLPDRQFTRADLPGGFLEIFEIPRFPQPRLLAEEELQAVVEWALAKRFIFQRISYAQATDNRFLVA